MAASNDPQSKPLLYADYHEGGHNPSAGTGVQQYAPPTTRPGITSFGSPPPPQHQQHQQQQQQQQQHHPQQQESLQSPPITMQPVAGRTFDVRLLRSDMQPIYYSLVNNHAESDQRLLSLVHTVGGQLMQSLDTTSSAIKVHDIPVFRAIGFQEGWGGVRWNL